LIGFEFRSDRLRFAKAAPDKLALVDFEIILADEDSFIQPKALWESRIVFFVASHGPRANASTVRADAGTDQSGGAIF
jgi:hypothetical protein